jgi:hypothetical protein
MGVNDTLGLEGVGVLGVLEVRELSMQFLKDISNRQRLVVAVGLGIRRLLDAVTFVRRCNDVWINIAKRSVAADVDMDGRQSLSAALTSPLLSGTATFGEFVQVQDVGRGDTILIDLAIVLGAFG